MIELVNFSKAEAKQKEELAKKIGSSYVEFFHQLPKGETMRLSAMCDTFKAVYPTRGDCTPSEFSKRMRQCADAFDNEYKVSCKDSKTYFTIA